MIRCIGGCEKDRPEEDFPWRNRERGIRQSFCKECKSRYNKAWYNKNKEKHKADVARNNAIRVADFVSLIRSYKDVPCKDCGVKYPPYVMDFDHLELFEKVSEVSGMRGWSLKKVKREIAKCEVVCANCHRERTFSRLASVSALPPKK